MKKQIPSYVAFRSLESYSKGDWNTVGDIKQRGATDLVLHSKEIIGDNFLVIVIYLGFMTCHVLS